MSAVFESKLWNAVTRGTDKKTRFLKVSCEQGVTTRIPCCHDMGTVARHQSEQVKELTLTMTQQYFYIWQALSRRVAIHEAVRKPKWAHEISIVGDYCLSHTSFPIRSFTNKR